MFQFRLWQGYTFFTQLFSVAACSLKSINYGSKPIQWVNPDQIDIKVGNKLAKVKCIMLLQTHYNYSSQLHRERKNLAIFRLDLVRESEYGNQDIARIIKHAYATVEHQ